MVLSGTSDADSSVPSVPPSAAASTPPLPEDIAELPAITPTSSNSTPPPPLNDNFFPEIDTKTKYARMSQIPDYRATCFPAVEPKAAHMPPLELVNANRAQRKSEQSTTSRKFEPENRALLRRKSDLSGVEERSPRFSNVSALPRRAGSPDFKQGPRRMSGTVTPLTTRSISPTGRSGVVSPLARNHSPIRSGAVSPLTHDEHQPQSFSRPQRRATFQQRQQRRAHHLKLTTQMLSGNGRPTSADSNEELEEVVMMSPVMRAPPKHIVRRSSTILSADGKLMSMPALESIVEGDKDKKKPYFGQEVDPEDLVAVNLANAFERL